MTNKDYWRHNSTVSCIIRDLSTSFMLVLRKPDKEVRSVKKAVLALGAALAFVGTIGNVTPMCMSVFYSPKKPAALK